MSIERILTAIAPADGTGMSGTAGMMTPGLPTGDAAGSFANSLDRLVGAVETSGAQANEAIVNMTDGTGDVHDAMIALQRADLTLQLTVQIRNKLVNAYQEIMRMPV
jgi:flagellar hook-basal body complex protein FliE